MHKDCCELTDQIYTSVPCCTSVAIKKSVAAFLAAAWVTSPACEWEHFYGNMDKSKPVLVCNIAPHITAFLTNVSVKGVQWTAKTVFHIL